MQFLTLMINILKLITKPLIHQICLHCLAAEWIIQSYTFLNIKQFFSPFFPFILAFSLKVSFCNHQVALWTLGQQVASTGYVVEPYRKYPSLLEVLLNFLKTEQNQGIRREVSTWFFILTSDSSVSPQLSWWQREPHCVAQWFIVGKKKLHLSTRTRHT